MGELAFLTWEFQALSVEERLRPIVSVDPGKRTGVALLGPDGRVWGTEAEWFGAMRYVETVLDRFLELGEADVLVVCERFTINEGTHKKAPDHHALEGIGVCRYEARRRDLVFELQMPVEAKRFATNSRLKAQGWYKSTPGGHVNDALRHLYLKLATTGVVVPPAGIV